MSYKDPERKRAYNAAYNAAHYAAHREERLARKRAYYAAHREERLAYSRAYEASHREERLARKRVHYAAHREEKRARERAYRAGRGYVTYVVRDGGDVVYVGSGERDRPSRHQRKSPWWRDGMTIEVIDQPTQAHARRDEYDLIIRYVPRYNRDGMGGLR